MARRPAYQPPPWWKRRTLTIPPNSPRTWLLLIAWETWMGMNVCLFLGFGVVFILTTPERIVTFTDLSACYGPPPVALPCEHVEYRGGMLNAAFTALIGFLMIGAAAWLLWVLWTWVEPKPITDDFLRLLHDSFGRSWKNPLTWPWARVFWAYGFAAVGAALTAGIVAFVLTLASPLKPPAGRIDTSESFRPTSNSR